MSDSLQPVEPLHAVVADALRSDGYAVCHSALPAGQSLALRKHLMGMDSSLYFPAGIGRQQDHSLTRSIRQDEICWINGESSVGRDWLAWVTALQQELNRSLLLGLFSFESHFAHYRPGAFYRRHLDAFRGEANRVLSLVAYLNPDWKPEDGGELVLYPENGKPITVLPEMSTLVVFLSEEFPHEVLPARRDRYSITGWFRVNSSVGGRVDPPA
ncbi:MAG: 2OG-Fe(II) oxygenase [Chromatocurvus sp.]